MARKKSVPTADSPGNELLEAIKKKGEAGVKGRKGYYRESPYGERSSSYYIPIEIVGIVMTGCSPQLRVKPIGGRGDFVLNSPCEFLPSLEFIDKKEAEEAKEKSINKDIEYLTSPTLVSERVRRLNSYIVDKVPGAFENQTIRDELVLDKFSTESPRFTSQFLSKYTKIAVGIVHGIPYEEVQGYRLRY